MNEKDLEKFKYNVHSAVEILKREDYAFIALVVHPEPPHESLLLCHTDEIDKMQALLAAATDLLDNYEPESSEQIHVDDKGTTQ